MPTLEDVKEGRVRVSQETLMGIKAIEDELEKDLKKITITGDNPLLKLRPEIEIGGKKTRNYLNTNDPVTIQTTGSYLTNDLSVRIGNTEASTDKSPEKESTKEIRFKNNFDDTPEDEVYDHFYAGLIYEEERDRQKDYLSKSDLDKFLKAAFEDKKPPENLFTFKNNKTKAQIYKPFHTYFKVVAVKRKRSEAEKKKGTDAALYASLLEDYFRNWTSVQANFNRYTKDD